VERGSKRSPELEKFHAWVKGRAAKKIDIETCDYWWRHGYVTDPYGVYHAELAEGEDIEDWIGRNYWVASPDSDGRIWDDDLPDDKFKALHARIERNHKLGLGNGDLLNEPNTPERERAAEEAAKAGHPFKTPNWLERAEGKEAGSIPLPRGID
jgi:hypothetical protein